MLGHGASLCSRRLRRGVVDDCRPSAPALRANLGGPVLAHRPVVVFRGCDQGLSRTILPAPGGTKAVPSATYTAPLGPTATPPVKESAPAVRNVWVPGLAKGILTTSPSGSSPQIQFGLVNSC